MSKFLLCAAFFSICALVRAADDSTTSPFELKYTAVDGTKVDVSQMRGKVVLIDFWATWCPPCRAEVPDIVATYNKYHDKGFDVVGVSLDQDKDEMLKFTKEHNMPWPQYFDGKGWGNAISSSLGVDRIPIMILLGKDGKPIRGNGSDNLGETVAKALQAQ